MSANDVQPQVRAVADGQHEVPPVGEEIHLPGGSVLPLAVAVGITAMVIGTTIWWVWSLCGFIIFLTAVGFWVRDSRREYAHLPDELDSDH